MKAMNLLYPVREIDKANEFPNYSGFSQDIVHIYTQISPNALNIWNFPGDTAEISEINQILTRINWIKLDYPKK